MTPPSLVDGKMPVVLYNLGGVFMNTVTGLAFFGLYFVSGELQYLSAAMLICDRVFCELVTSGRSDVIKDMLTKEQIKFMKAMKKNLSVLRTEYAYALIAENDTEKAGRIKEMFETIAKNTHIRETYFLREN